MHFYFFFTRERDWQLQLYIERARKNRIFTAIKHTKVVGSNHGKWVNWFVMYNHSKHAQDCKEMPYQKPFLKATIFSCLLWREHTKAKNIFLSKKLIFLNLLPFQAILSRKKFKVSKLKWNFWTKMYLCHSVKSATHA